MRRYQFKKKMPGGSDVTSLPSFPVGKMTKTGNQILFDDFVVVVHSALLPQEIALHSEIAPMALFIPNVSPQPV
jgi:hypothetical protein